MQKIEQNAHITEELWIALSHNAIGHQDYMKILEHTCDCTWCAEHLAEVMEGEQKTAKPPAYLREQILNRTAQIDVRAVTTVRRTSKQLRLLMYSLKVGLAVAVCTILLAVSTNVQRLGTAETDAWLEVREDLQEQDQREPEGMLERMNRFSQNAAGWMNRFSNYLLTGEK